MHDTAAFPDFPMRSVYHYGFASDLIETIMADAANDNAPRTPGDSFAKLAALADVPKAREA